MKRLRALWCAVHLRFRVLRCHLDVLAIRREIARQQRAARQRQRGAIK